MARSRSQCALGLDYGSDSARAVLVDTSTGREVAEAVAEYPRWKRGMYCDPARQQFRQHPQDYLDVLVKTVKGVLAAAGAGAAERVVGIGIDTTGSTPGPVDATGMALALKPEFKDDPDAMFVLWKDHTAVAEAERFNELAHSGDFKHDYSRFVGGIYSSEWYWAKAAKVLKGNAKVRKATASWVEHCDWLPALLTGTADPATLARGRCSAGHKACWHASWGGLPDADFLRALHPSLPKLAACYASETHTVDHAVGGLTGAWARKLGLPTGTAVAVGAFDAHLGAVGAGARPNILTKVMGTSTCDMLLAKPEEIGRRTVRGICGQVDGSIVPGMVGLEAGQSAFGDAYAWFRRLLAWPLGADAKLLPKAQQKLAESLIDGMLPALERVALALPPGSHGELALDWHNGRRTPNANQRLRGAMTGINLGSDAPALYRALVESTAYGARAIVDCFVDQGVAVKGVLALGGIARKSQLVMQTCADVFERPIDVVKSDQCCALGAAIAGAVAGGAFRSIAAAQKVMASPVERRYTPDRKRAKAYRALYADYRKLGGFVESTLG
ncbi:MAG: ribulokinase [Planctomycetota bacterium]|jgi:L-ribulokinase|nr:ribulokinase [Planctomycetota bacterium]